MHINSEAEDVGKEYGSKSRESGKVIEFVLARWLGTGILLNAFEGIFKQTGFADYFPLPSLN